MQYRGSAAAPRRSRRQAHGRKRAGKDDPRTRLSLRAPFELPQLRSPWAQNVSLQKVHLCPSTHSAESVSAIRRSRSTKSHPILQAPTRTPTAIPPTIPTARTHAPQPSPELTGSQRTRRRTAASHWPVSHARWAAALSSLRVAAAAHAQSAPAGPAARSRRNAPSRQAGRPPRMRSRDPFGNVPCRLSRSSLPLQGKSCQGTGRPQPRSSPPRRPGLSLLPHPAAARALLLTARPLADSPAPCRRAATSPLPPCLFLIPPLSSAAPRRVPRAGPASGVLCGAAAMGPPPQGELRAPLGSAAAGGARAAARSAPPSLARGRWSSRSLRCRPRLLQMFGASSWDEFWL